MEIAATIQGHLFRLLVGSFFNPKCIFAVKIPTSVYELLNFGFEVSPALDAIGSILPALPRDPAYVWSIRSSRARTRQSSCVDEKAVNQLYSEESMNLTGVVFPLHEVTVNDCLDGAAIPVWSGKRAFIEQHLAYIL